MTTKHNFVKERKDLKNRNKLLENENKQNNENKLITSNMLNGLKDELSYFKIKTGFGNDNENKDDDVLLMVDMLNDIRSQDIDIYAGLNDSQKASLNEILGRYKISEDKVENNTNVNNNANNNPIYDVIYILIFQDEEIIKKIEEIVNSKFYEKKIINIKIDQVDEDTYKFNDKVAVLLIENDILKLKNGPTFEDWVTFNFSSENKTAQNVKKEKAVGINSKPNSSKNAEKKNNGSQRSTTPTRQKAQ